MISCRSSNLVELEFGDVGFCGGRKTGKPREKPSELGDNQQTQPTNGAWPESKLGHIGRRRSSVFTTAPTLLPKKLTINNATFDEKIL